MTPRPPISTLFPYTTLFRSRDRADPLAHPRGGRLGRARSREHREHDDRVVEHDARRPDARARSEEHTSELQSLAYLVCRLLLEKKKRHRYKETRPHHR